MSFTSLGLSDAILRAIEEKGYKTPSPIQSKAIPAILDGKDVMAAAQTGTGKTAGFTLPMLEILSRSESVKSNSVRALVLTPTRELAAQVAESVEHYGKFLPLRSAVVFGGVKINPQMMKLRRGVDILVATPGRLMDLYSQNAVKFSQLEILVLDEADRMLDMGFIRDIRKILALLPPRRQTLMFSATFSDEIRALTKGLLNQPVEIEVSPRNTTAQTVNQWICTVDKSRKTNLLIHLIKKNNWSQVLVFTRTKHGANRLTEKLGQSGIKAAAIHGNKSQGARTRALADFKSGTVRVLVATDIAARGLDIAQLPQVVNFELPNIPEDYVHRIGRTGRAGADGQAVSLVSADEAPHLQEIERLLKKKLVREVIDGFETGHDVPESNIASMPRAKSKPRPQGQNRPAAKKKSTHTKRSHSGSGQRNEHRPSGSATRSNKPGN
ncbi:MAG: DEAD/DEAH box helicase [Gammaproteobacteria bacterium]|nr:DEAD/DEAH box helicase [Gammaproteobacteria bacterium]